MKTVQLLLLSFVLFSCSNSETQNTSTLITPELISNGTLFGAGDENISEQNVVISNQTVWNLLQTKMNLVNPTFAEYPNIVDFANYKVIAIFDKVQNSGGFSIGIASVIETESQILINVSHTEPNENAVLWITQPFYIVKIPQTSKPINFN